MLFYPLPCAAAVVSGVDPDGAAAVEDDSLLLEEGAEVAETGYVDDKGELRRCVRAWVGGLRWGWGGDGERERPGNPTNSVAVAEAQRFAWPAQPPRCLLCIRCCMIRTPRPRITCRALRPLQDGDDALPVLRAHALASPAACTPEGYQVALVSHVFT